MNKQISTNSEFEMMVQKSFGVLEIRAEFVVQIYEELMQKSAKKTKKVPLFFRLRPAWIITLIILFIMILGALVIGPPRVYATVMRFFGYIPDIGIVEQSSPIRILDEPVNVTRDGITVSVNQAVLTNTETRIIYGISGVPLSAYAKDESIVPGCIEKEYLRLPDGSEISIHEPIPLDVDNVIFVLPCIFNTLPDTVPSEWEMPLSFVLAQSDFTLQSVIEVSSQPTISENRLITQGEPTSDVTLDNLHAVVTVDKMIETEDGYILLGTVIPDIPTGSWLQIIGDAVIRDADDKTVKYTPTNIQQTFDEYLAQGGTTWAVQFKSSRIKFPVTISFSGTVRSQLDPQASAEITVDVGNDPKPGQVWEVNQEAQLAGNTITLLSITAGNNGYSFQIDPGPNLSDISVHVEGYEAIGGGGGGGSILQGSFSTSLIFSELPTGELTILFTNPLFSEPAETWLVEWQPEEQHELSNSNSLLDVCWDSESFRTIPLLPDGLEGKVIVTQVNPQLQIVIANMDGSQLQILVEGGSNAALTLDNLHMAYSTDEGIVVMNLQNEESLLISGVLGRDLHWSKDGDWIAYVSSSDSYGIFVMDHEGKNPKQLSNLGYESIAGWSQDGSELYFAIPDSSGGDFLLRSVNLATGEIQDLFVLEDSSLKAPLSTVSSDGEWIAYRGSDNSSLYLKSMDGNPARLLMENPAIAINGIVWGKERNNLGVSLVTLQNPGGEIILIALDSCESYRLPDVFGKLDCMFLP